MGVAGPDHPPVARRKVEQRLGQCERPLLKRPEGVLEEEPEIAGDLIVSRAAGVQALAEARQAAGQPLLDRGVDVLVTASDGEAPGVYGSQRLPETSAEPPV